MVKVTKTFYNVVVAGSSGVNLELLGLAPFVHIRVDRLSV